MDNLIGKSIERYSINKQVGLGGMATVYRAYDERLEREVAIKIIRTDAFPPNQLSRILKRFEREAKALGRLSHPNIIKVIDFGEYEGAPYLVMEFLPGGTVKQLLGKPIPWQDAVNIILPIAEALEYAHEQKIIHRDIKPSNILLTQKGQPMLTDFGIAKILETDDTFTLTGTGIGVGTPDYMAPEQWTGSATAQCDIYSLGVVLYEMVTGKKPFTADTPAAILLKQATEPLKRPSSIVSGLPDALEGVLLKSLASDMKVRYQNVGEMIAGLEQLLDGRKKSARIQPVPGVGFDEEATRDVITGTGFTNATRTQTSGSGVKPPLQPAKPVTVNSPAKKNISGGWLWGTGIALVICAFFAGVLGMGGLLSGFFGGDPTATPNVVYTEPPSVVEPVVESVRNPTDTRVPPTNVPPPTQYIPPSYDLKYCELTSEDYCVYSISPQPSSVIISLKFRNNTTSSNMPRLTVDGRSFGCEILAAYPGRIICTGSSSGYVGLVLESREGYTIATGYFQIDPYVAPAPTKKKGGGGSSYP